MTLHFNPCDIYYTWILDFFFFTMTLELVIIQATFLVFGPERPHMAMVL